MTNSVAADGQTTLTGALKGYAGSVGAPGYSFASDSNCGFYRIAADNIGASCAGAKVLDISATGLGVTGTLTSSSTITATAAAIVAGTTVTAGTLVLVGNGAVGAPSLSFTNDTDSGFYRIGAGNIGLAIDGSKVLDLGAGGLTITGDLSISGAIGVNGGFAQAASQAEQETATATDRLVTPGRQHFHPSASKCWLKCDHNGTVNASYNVTSITDGANGVVTVTIATDLSSANYAVVATTGSAAVSPYVRNDEQAAGQFIIRAHNTNSGAAQDSTLGYYAVAFGDL
jgi:hypothetical protein